MLIILILGLFSFSKAWTCSDSIYCNPQVLCGQRGGASYCLCVAGCSDYTNTCVNKTISKPVKEMKYPQCIPSFFNPCKNYSTICPSNCDYDNKERACKFVGVNGINYPDAICEPTITLRCPHDEYTINVRNYSYCSIEPSNICILQAPGQSNWVLRYPIRLENKFPNILCKFSKIGKCETKRFGRMCCN
jgi:hypothetical protein